MYNLYITGSHFGERFSNIAKMGGGGGAVIDRWQIRTGQNPKIGGRQIQPSVPRPKESVLYRGIDPLIEFYGILPGISVLRFVF